MKASLIQIIEVPSVRQCSTILKTMSFCGKTAITTFKLIQNAKVGGVSENSGYLLIFKIEKEMTEKIKPKFANPPPKMVRFLCSQYTSTDPLPKHPQLLVFG